MPKRKDRNFEYRIFILSSRIFSKKGLFLSFQMFTCFTELSLLWTEISLQLMKEINLFISIFSKQTAQLYSSVPRAVSCFEFLQFCTSERKNKLSQSCSWYISHNCKLQKHLQKEKTIDVNALILVSTRVIHWSKAKRDKYNNPIGGCRLNTYVLLLK